MFHYVNAIQNTRGDALIGYFVRLTHPVTGAEVDIYSDESGTPIEVESGLANAAKVDGNGNVSLYVNDGEYNVRIYATDGQKFIKGYDDFPMAKIGMLKAETKADVATADTGYPVTLMEEGSEGIFFFRASDQSLQVTSDPEQNNYIAPSSDDTGESGAWVRSGSQTVQDSVESKVLRGCGVAYRELLIFDMGAGSYLLDGIGHTAAEQSVTLDPADGDDPRIDVLALDAEGNFVAVAGTPAASPSKPSVDPTELLELTFVLVPANAVDLSEVTTEDLYLENTEWAATQSGTALNLESTSNPYAGTKCIETTGVFVTGNYLQLARPGGNEAFGGDGNLILRVRSKGPWNAKRTLAIQWYCDGATVGTTTSLRNGAYGFESSVTANYQVVIIPKSVFAIPAHLEIDALRITSAGSGNGNPQFYLDNIQLQTNGSAIGSGDLTQSIADARYINVDGDEMTGPLLLPDEDYGPSWNGSRAAPTKNALYDKIETIAGSIPGAYTDEQAQDAVGTILVDSSRIDFTYSDATPSITADIVAGSIGTTQLSNDGVTYAKMQNVSATDKLLGRSTSGAGDVEEITCTAAGRAILDDADAAAQRTTLGAQARSPAIQSVTSSATVTPTFSDDQVNITAQAAALNLANPTGTAIDGLGIAIRIKDNGTARAITYGTQYRAIGVTLPTTTVLSKTLYLGMVYNSTDTKWDVVAVQQEA